MVTKNSQNKEDYQYQERVVTAKPHRSFAIGTGKISGYASLFLGILSVAGVLAFLYPSYLTTTELRSAYDAEILQGVLKYGMYFSLIFASMTFLIAKRRRMGFAGIALTTIAFVLGGYKVPIGVVEPRTLSLGVDWFILSLLSSVFVFMAIEKLFPKYKEQLILRDEWRLDFGYFILSHFLITAIILFGNYISSLFQWAVSLELQAAIQALPFAVQFVAVLICADFVLYWQHRLFHVIPRLWRAHAVHHSVETMDWLAGSRGHFTHIFIERALVVVPLYLLGPDKVVLDLYVTFAAIQATIIHCNLGLNFGPLKYIFVTPQFHHWHHSSEQPAIDTNYAAHLTIFDKCFNTYHLPKHHWPAEYGTTKRLPRTFWGQFIYPFRSETG